jgi:multimeric flavodoxin WrbA
MNKMRILAICGSPRKGNSYSILNSIKEKYTAIDIKMLMLNEVNLNRCKGCYTCVLIGEEKCPLKDDRDMIVQEMRDADGVVVATPTYAVQVPWILKNFIDRISYFGHRPQFFDKFAMSIATGAGYGIDEPNKYMSKMFSGFGFSVVPSLELQVLPKKIMSEKRKVDNEKKTIKAFDVFVDRIKKKKRDKPSKDMVIVFNIFKTVSGLCKDVYKADYEYYKDKTGYYYDTKISFYHKLVAKSVVDQVMRG